MTAPPEKGKLNLGVVGWIVALVLLGVVIYCFACRKTDGRDHGNGPPRSDTSWVWLDTLQSCPHYWSRLATRVQDTIAPLSLTTIDVPEYHDCQKLVVPGSADYGPLAVVFAAEQVESLPQVQARLSARAGRPMAAAAATILSIGGDYPVLGIKEHANCLYLWKDGSWSARVVPVTDVGQKCREEFDRSSADGTPLTVHVTAAEPGSTFHPAVARWERAADGTPYVSVRCGDEYCAAGPVGSAPPPALTIAESGAFTTWLNGLPRAGVVPVITSTALRELVAARGWYDEQRLAPAGGGTAASEIVGTIIPNPNLDRFEDTHFDKKWQTTALIWIPTPTSTAGNTTVSEYTSKMNLRAGWNAIATCAGTAATCLPPGATTPATCAAMPPDTRVWFGQVISMAGGDPRYYCTVRIGAYKHVIGTARWRWIKNDETTWVRCVNGCCELDT